MQTPCRLHANSNSFYDAAVYITLHSENIQATAKNIRLKTVTKQERIASK